MTTFFNESIDNWVDAINTTLCQRYEMKKFNLSPSKYGYDSYAAVLTAILSNVDIDDVVLYMRGQLTDVSRYVELAHEAWTSAYLRWKADWALSNNPRRSVNTHCRNDRATTQAKYLCETDLNLYNDIIVSTFDILSKNILEAGMKKLTI